MRLNTRKKRFIRRMAGYATNPIAVKVRTLRRQEQRYDIAGIPVVLPPEHNLPFYQRRDPTYDHYAVALLWTLAQGERRVTVIDVGANVGDTAAAVLAADPRTAVISVEGDQRFLSYLHRNVAPFSDRASVVEGFVGPVGASVAYSRDGSTGGFNAVGGDDPQVVDEWVRPADLVAIPDAADLVVWKSDIDGFDIHVLAQHWDVIDSRCDVIWVEYDPPRTLGDPADVDRVIAALAGSGRTVLVYDNLGRRMVSLAPGEGQIAALRTLSDWLGVQYAGHVTVPYLDLWALSPEAAKLLSA
ncbi:hypothetical protein [Rudaeicoccus suwonensis]|uniref:FkbM family methyltransferase n=1 Tax=Rudaeicoccus suwonensis TaxID=657409 RepID=A0A561E8Q0_9MICO|nr:hypothetical protein [Rudaeicoccus suwonensis]TWE11998.1 FkbM family methyltransferase [Rudaeicoccus suwonensis]